MWRTKKRMQVKKAGFTLMELIIAMAILAIITSSLLGGYMSSQKKARDAQRKSDLKQIQNALEAYANDYRGRYPDADSGRIGGVAWGGEFNNPSATTTIYMKVLPEDPKGVDYLYWVSSDNTGYRLYACLENDQDSDYNVYTGIICAGCGSTDDEECTYGAASSNETL